MSGKRDSNPRPPAWKASALSTELFPQDIPLNRTGSLCPPVRKGETHKFYTAKDGIFLTNFKTFDLQKCAFDCKNFQNHRMLQHPPFKICGESRIRTYEDISQQSYSLPQLATLVSPLLFKELSLFALAKIHSFTKKTKISIIKNEVKTRQEVY